MTITITVGDVFALSPAADFDGSAATLACCDASEAYRVLRSIMDYGYTHAEPEHVTLVCADEAVAAAYHFQWNMWYAERRPD